MTGADPITVVLVRCSPARTAGLVAAGVRVLAAADDARAAVEAAREGADVVVVDLDGGTDALSDVALVADALPGVAVLAVSASEEHAHVLAAVRAGAVGYVVATGTDGEIADAVRRLARGEVVFSPGLASVVLEAHGGLGEPAAARLTDREIDVLRLVVEGLTARQIATRLVLSPRTVENRVQIMLRKLGLANRAQLVRYALEHGLA